MYFAQEGELCLAVGTVTVLFVRHYRVIYTRIALAAWLHAPTKQLNFLLLQSN